MACFVPPHECMKRPSAEPDYRPLVQNIQQSGPAHPWNPGSCLVGGTHLCPLDFLSSKPLLTHAHTHFHSIPASSFSSLQNGRSRSWGLVMPPPGKETVFGRDKEDLGQLLPRSGSPAVFLSTTWRSAPKTFCMLCLRATASPQILAPQCTMRSSASLSLTTPNQEDNYTGGLTRWLISINRDQMNV